MPYSAVTKSCALSAGVFVLSVSLSYVIFAWTNPTTQAPNGNVDAPINVGSVNQSKTGNLSIGTGSTYWITKNGDSFVLKNDAGVERLILGQDGSTTINGQVRITGGSPGAGKILTSDAGGLAAWQTPASGGIYGSGTTNYIPKFTSVSTLGNSLIFDNGTNVGIGTTAPGAKLDVSGDVQSSSKVTSPQYCIGTNCIMAWPNGVTPGNCNTDEVMTGIDATGKIVCSPLSTLYWTPNPCATALPPGGKRVFVTSTVYTGNDLTGDTAADQKCQTAANATGYTGTYKALLYLKSRMPADDLPSGNTFWNGGKSGLDGTACLWNLVALNTTAMFTKDASGKYLQNPIQFNEQGYRVANLAVWTNFMPTGGGGYSTLRTNCNNWQYIPCTTTANKACIETFNSFAGGGMYTCAESYYGLNTSTDVGWAFNLYQGSSHSYCSGHTDYNSCMAQSRALYCVEQ